MAAGINGYALWSSMLADGRAAALAWRYDPFPPHPSDVDLCTAKAEATTIRTTSPVLSASKKKGCKQKKCSNWKGGRCHCGRD